MIFKEIGLKRSMCGAVVERIRLNLPKSTSGVFIADAPYGVPDEFHIFKTNVRNSGEWKPFFESYGGHHMERDDTGFVVGPEEMFELFLYLRRRNKVSVGVFHTHKLLPAIFTDIDRDLHSDPDLWHLVVSVLDVQRPELRAYCVDGGSVHEVEINYIEDEVKGGASVSTSDPDPRLTAGEL
jgi:proteasome lid subunit RPN8/RPN11